MDKSFRWKLLLLIVLVALAAWSLYPTVQLYSKPKAEQTAPENEKLRDKSMKLGLDLLGGMNLVLELDRSKLRDEEVSDALDRAMEILRNRIDQFGVAEPSIQKQGEDRILIQLPGLTDKQRAIELIGQTALLEFKLVLPADRSAQALERIDRAVAAAQKGEPADTSAVADSLAMEDTRHPFLDLLYNYPDMSVFSGAMVLDSNVERVQEMLDSIDLSRVLPADAELAFSADPENFGNGVMGAVIYVLKKQPEMTGEAIANANMSFDIDRARPGQAGVLLTMNASGTNTFRRVTGANVGRHLAIVLDHKVKSAPVIQNRIPSGRASITGSFTDQEARDLAIVLRAGALPAPINIIEERTVGPSLGADSIRSGLMAGLIGAAAVVLFMLVYYRMSGGIAVLGLVLNIFFLFGVLSAMRGTLTLPGIAGIVLTIGMAVDANVLIFERIREELRAGKRVRPAIEAGYDRALRTIMDSNLTTLISALVLAQFGTGPIKGFAVTLGIGIIANLYTAVFVTRMVYDLVTARRTVRNLSI
ncbi:MAG: protein translocase subunit SecD [Candidatus Eisenbacteria bacterium]